MLQFLWFSSETNATWKNSYIFQKSYRIQHNIIILRISYFCKFPISQKKKSYISNRHLLYLDAIALSGGWHAPQLHYCESGCYVWAISETLLHWPWSYSAKVCALQCPETCFLPMAIRLNDSSSWEICREYSVNREIFISNLPFKFKSSATWIRNQTCRVPR
jgi:hypothetical protein